MVLVAAAASSKSDDEPTSTIASTLTAAAAASSSSSVYKSSGWVDSAFPRLTVALHSAAAAHPHSLLASSSPTSFSSLPPPAPLSSTSAIASSPPYHAASLLAMAASTIAYLFSFLFFTIPSILYWCITFTTITLPTALFTLFSMSLTFTMNFTTLLLIALVLVSTISWFIRYRFLNMYSRLPPEPQRKEPQIDLFPDTQGDDSKPGLSNYLDEFFSAIKVFGYLERPVFHELTRMMQTRKLIAGETLLLEEEKGFCLVVDGAVQIFVKSNTEELSRVVVAENEDEHGCSEDDDDAILVNDSVDEDEEHYCPSQGYQLLTEVKNGASMSSLFSILSLFSEDVNLRHTDHSSDSGASSARPESHPASPPRTPLLMENSPPRRSESAEHTQTTPLGLNGPSSLPKVPPLALEDTTNHNNITSPSPRQKAGFRNEKPLRSRSRSVVKPKSIHPDIVARAMVDTTIAIIPASAFRRLTKIYPRASAHIIQVILTRLQRVTFATAHSYLGLTTEVLSIEKMMGRFTSFDLPNHLRGGPLDRLREKFSQEGERLGLEESTKGIALHNPAVNRQRRRSSSSLRKEAALQAKLAAAQGRSSLRHSPRSDLGGVSPGDLLSSIHLSRYGPRGPRRDPSRTRDLFYDTTTINPTAGGNCGAGGAKQPTRPPTSPSPQSPPSFRRRDAVDEESLLRESIIDCIMKALGLTERTREALRKVHQAGEASPQLVSFDAKRQKAVFNHAFGFIDPYESGDGDSESVMSMSATSVGGSSSSLASLREELLDDLEIVYFPKSAVLVEQGERNPGLYYVIDGFLDVGIPVNEKGEDIIGSSSTTGPSKRDDLFLPLASRTAATINNRQSSATSPPGSAKPQGARKKVARRSLYMVKPGGIEGYIGSVTSYRSFTDVTAKTNVYVGFLPRICLERIADKYPLMLLTVAKRLTTVLPRLILHIDFALEWVQVNAGQVIYHQGDESDAIYIVLNGRLRSVIDRDNGKVSVMGEYGQGDSVGELEVMTESARPATLHAIRDTELAKFPRTLFNSLAQEHPGITIQISKLIAQRMRSIIHSPLLEKGGESASRDSGGPTSTSTMNLRTVAVLPVTTGVPVVEFSNRLLQAFTQVGVNRGVTALHQADILNHLGRHAFSRMGKLKLSQYLADLEERYGMVLYVADTPVNAPWTQTCITQADCILLVAVAEGSTSVGEYERFMLGMKTTSRKELVLLHIDRFSRPGLTRQWLKNRVWINGGHHHIQMAFGLTADPTNPQPKRFGTVLKQRVQVLQAEIQKYTSRRIQQAQLYSAATPFKGDFHRLARRLCGKSVGVVLGGGGARGFAHLGVIRALEEAGIPIDIVGGTSIGAFIGALYARDADAVPTYGRAKKFAGRMASLWRFALDLTYPSASYTTGHEFNRGIFKALGNSQIEDFWLDFYCNTTNISKSRLEFHSSGYAWRYVRASMSLAGLLPPLCDEGSMLLDGGYVDNLTVARMKSLGAHVIFAVDVGSIDDDTPQGYGDSLSGFWAVLNRWNPFSTTANPPTLSEIQARLAYVSSHDALDRAKSTPGCLYMRPPIDSFATLDFAKFDDIYQTGYRYGKEFLEKLKTQGALPIQEETEAKKNLRRTMAPRRASI